MLQFSAVNLQHPWSRHLLSFLRQRLSSTYGALILICAQQKSLRVWVRNPTPAVFVQVHSIIKSAAVVAWEVCVLAASNYVFPTNITGTLLDWKKFQLPSCNGTYRKPLQTGDTWSFRDALTQFRSCQSRSDLYTHPFFLLPTHQLPDNCLIYTTHKSLGRRSIEGICSVMRPLIWTRPGDSLTFSEWVEQFRNICGN